MIKHTLEQMLITISKKENWKIGALELEQPKNPDHGDYALNIAFQLAREWKKPPVKIAEEITAILSNNTELSKIVTISIQSGFINLRLTDTFLWGNIHDQTPFPQTTHKTVLEYVSANPTGPLHIGHGRWAVLGSALYNLLKYVGEDVKSEFYINDAGNQIVKFYDSVNAAKAGDPIPEDGYHGAYILELAKKTEDPLMLNIQSQEETLTKLGIKFDVWFSEKSLHESNAVNTSIEKLKALGVTYESEGALWFRTTDYGDEKDRVLIKADGAYTYFAVDIAYHDNKIKRGFSRLINIWGADHHGYINRVRAGVAALCPDKFKDETTFKIMIGQLVSLTRGGQAVRMSKRTGEMITLDEVIEEIGSDAARFFLVHKGPDTHIEFDLELAKTKTSENPVFYIQYAHARLSNILKRITPEPQKEITSPLNEYERQLLLLALQMKDVVWESASHLAPHKVAQYAFQLARYTHLFYETCPIAQADESDKNKRTQILIKAKETLAEVLSILGITAPEEM